MATDVSPFLQRRSTFRSLPDAALERLTEIAREVHFDAGERIAPLIDPPKRLVLLTSGLAKLTAATLNGHERIVFVFRPGDLVGSRVFLENSAEAVYEVVAMTRVDGVAIELLEFFAAGRRHPEIVLAATRAFTRRLGVLTDRLMAVMAQDVPGRLCRFLLDFVPPDRVGSAEFGPLEYPLTHETMAGVVGASRPHTSSVLADLEAVGVVLRKGRKLLVRPLELERFAQRDEGLGSVSPNAG